MQPKEKEQAKEGPLTASLGREDGNFENDRFVIILPRCFLILNIKL